MASDSEARAHFAAILRAAADLAENPDVPLPYADLHYVSHGDDAPAMVRAVSHGLPCEMKPHVRRNSSSDEDYYDLYADLPGSSVGHVRISVPARLVCDESGTRTVTKTVTGWKLRDGIDLPQVPEREES